MSRILSPTRASINEVDSTTSESIKDSLLVL